MTMSNSPLVNYTRISPNRNSPRNAKICYITPHCVVGQCTVESLGNVFAPVGRQASSNYGIGYDGRVGMYCPESDRSWCSSSAWNDNRAITIEVASDNFHPYAVKKAAYDKLIKLCVDICKRYGKKKLLFLGKDKTLEYTVKSDEMVLTAHRWFASTICPGDYLYSRFDDIAKEVTKELQKEEKSVFNDIKKTDKNYDEYKAIYDLGIMKVDKNGNFNPKKKVTRGALAIILYRVLKKVGVIK